MKNFILSIVLLSVSHFSGCMMATGGMHGGMMGGHHGNRESKREEDINSAMDNVVRRMVSDLSESKLKLKSLAVWGFESNDPSIHLEMFENKLEIALVETNVLKIVERKKLKVALEEQSLNISGAIDEKSAKEAGTLAGVDGFIYGTASIHDGMFIVDTKIIDVENGVIIWGKEVKTHFE